MSKKVGLQPSIKGVSVANDGVAQSPVEEFNTGELIAALIDPSVKPWALALGIEASPLKADRVVGDIPLLTLSTFYTILEQVFWYRHN
ncbi:hypothetical protein KSD_83510 [Ktedonobacter sp. SOSP1-85]|nr:hypothetical protein KSD_83510 [Ktedonobacter sp. SOSP1-85]